MTCDVTQVGWIRPAGEQKASPEMTEAMTTAQATYRTWLKSLPFHDLKALYDSSTIRQAPRPPFESEPSPEFPELTSAEFLTRLVKQEASRIHADIGEQPALWFFEIMGYKVELVKE